MRDTGVRERLKSYGLIERDRREPTRHADAVEATLVWESTILSMVVVVPKRAMTAKDLGVPFSLDDGSVLVRPGPKRSAPEIFLPDGTPIPEDARGWIRMSGTRATLRLERVASGKKTPRASAADQDARASYGISALGHVLLFAALLAIARFAPATSAETESTRVDAIRAYLAAADGDNGTDLATNSDAEGSSGEAMTDGNASGVSGKRAAGEEGAMGNPAHSRANSSYQRHQAPPRTTSLMEFDPAHDGMIALLTNDDHDRETTSAFADHEVPGAMGNMWGDAIGDSFGVGGVSLSGVGEGGGGNGAGVGLSHVGTVGGGGGTAGEGSMSGTCDAACQAARFGSGFGSCGHAGCGRMLGQHIVGPTLRCGYTTAEIARGTDCDGLMVDGRLPPETVQRVVRSNFGKLRACYERGLEKNPTLEGKVSVNFVIDRDGSVSAATLAEGSSMPDATVSSCVVAMYKTMSFPEPAGGIVTVVYPVTFSPA